MCRACLRIGAKLRLSRALFLEKTKSLCDMEC